MGSLNHRFVYSNAAGYATMASASCQGAPDCKEVPKIFHVWEQPKRSGAGLVTRYSPVCVFHAEEAATRWGITVPGELLVPL
jgi:hypothetical protein